MGIRRVITAFVALLLAAGGVALVAPSASADQIWYQGVARASADTPCPTTSSDDRTAGWSEWSPSWAQWANGGKGGYVCTRAITWARESTGGDSGCYLANTAEAENGPFWAKPTTWFIAAGSDVDVYSDASCTDFLRVETPPVNVVIAPGGQGQAQARCTDAFGEGFLAVQPEEAHLGPAIWLCFPEEDH